MAVVGKVPPSRQAHLFQQFRARAHCLVGKAARDEERHQDIFQRRERRAP